MENTKQYSWITQRGIQITLGILWLLDGALQLQHQMFTSSFATQVITPAADGQPRFVNGFMHFWIHIFLMHPAFWNAMIAVVQLGLGALILWRRTARVGLLLSVAWGFFVWYAGEGLGGVFSGQTSLLMGAPGAALLYAILAVATLPKNEDQPKHRQPAMWLALVWVFFWVGGAVYQLLPGQNSTTAVGSMISGGASGAPGWLASLDMHVGNAINGFGAPTTQGTGYWFILFLAILQLTIGLGVLAKRSTREVALWVGIGLSVVFWFVGQNLGEYYSGLATDPSTAPLFILLGLAILSQTKLDQDLANVYAKVEKLFI